MVRDSKPPVLEDRERRERNHLFAEEQKQKDGSSMRSFARERPWRSAVGGKYATDFPKKSPRRSQTRTTRTSILFRMRRRRKASRARCRGYFIRGLSQGLSEHLRLALCPSARVSGDSDVFRDPL